jgi:ribonuclease D
MLPYPPAVVKCRQCAECFWLVDAKIIGTTDPWADEEVHVGPAPAVREPTEEEYYEALRKGLARDPQQERALRILAWWRRNDAFRDASEHPSSTITSVTGECRKNLEALVSLLDETNENDQVMKAELLRELGEFGASQQVLERVTSANYATIVRQLRSLCAARDPCVRQLRFDN